MMTRVVFIDKSADAINLALCFLSILLVLKIMLIYTSKDIYPLFVPPLDAFLQFQG